MNKYLPKELRNLKESKQRVMQNVEHSIKKKKKFPTVKVIGAIIASAAVIGIGFYSLAQLNEPNNTASENPNPIEIIQGQYDELLRSYFPDDRTQKMMLDSDNKEYVIETYWLSPNYVLEIEIGSIKSYTYYRIANNKIEIVYADSDFESKHEQLTVEELKTKEAISTLVEAPFKVGNVTEEWVVKDVDTTYGLYEQVLILERDDAGYISTIMLAPKYGIVSMVGTKNEEIGYSKWLGYLSYMDEGAIDMRFKKIENVLDQPVFHTPWQSSPSGKYQVTLEGRGDQGGEEAVGVIVVNEIGTNKYTHFEITNVPYQQITPKRFTWIDDNRLFVIIGMAHGTVTVGGELFILDINDNRLTPIITDLSTKEEIATIFSENEYVFRYEKVTFLTDMMEIEDSDRTQGTIEFVEAVIQRVEDNNILYNLSKSTESNLYKVDLKDNLDPNAVGLEDVQKGDLVELIVLDNVVVAMNKIEQ